MTPADYIHRLVLPVAYHLLPEAMRSADATALLLAIGMQESRFTHRRQVVISYGKRMDGPARGFWQFEAGGVSGVLKHRATRPFAERVCATLGYEPVPMEIHEALEHNDVLAACFARLLLYADPRPIPRDADGAWEAYMFGWRPGKPHPATWAGFYDAARQTVRA